MSLGLRVDKSQLDDASGAAARGLRQSFTAAQRIKEYLDGKTDQELIDEFGYTSAEVATLRAAMSATDQLRTIFEGTTTLATVKNFRNFVKPLWGIGL
jgi:hypothetical protein